MSRRASSIIAKLSNVVDICSINHINTLWKRTIITTIKYYKTATYIYMQKIYLYHSNPIQPDILINPQLTLWESSFRQVPSHIKLKSTWLQADENKKKYQKKQS